MEVRKEVSESYRSKAKILATISSGLFVASGVFASFYTAKVSASLNLMSSGASVMTASGLNRTLRSNISHTLFESSKDILGSSHGTMAIISLFLGFGTVLAFWSLLIWKKSHRILLGTESLNKGN